MFWPLIILARISPVPEWTLISHIPLIQIPVFLQMVRIKDTLHLGEIEISEAMLPEAKALENIEILSEPYELNFNEDGDLF